MDQKAIEGEARLAALEFLQRLLLVDYFGRTPDPQAAIASTRGAVRRRFAKETVEGVEPVQSDHAIAEIEKAVDEQLIGALELLEAARKRQSGQPDL